MWLVWGFSVCIYMCVTSLYKSWPEQDRSEILKVNSHIFLVK